MLIEEVSRCLLCHEAQCTKQCAYGQHPDQVIRAVRFENVARGAAIIEEDGGARCVTCESKACEKACTKGKMAHPIQIQEVMGVVVKEKTECVEAIDLATTFCGVECENPFFLSSSVVGSNYEMVKKAFEMGWAGVAFKTIGLFVPDEVSPRFDAMSKEDVPFVGFKNIEQISEYTLQENLNFLKRLKQEFPSKIIVASIMGRDETEWTKLAQLMSEVGADIIECNFSCPHMASDGVGSDVGQDPELVARYTTATRKGTSLPILAKMTPNLGSMIPPAVAAMEAGATGIAAINTIKSIMNVNLEDFSTGPSVRGKSSVGGYSGKAVKPIALRFIQEMKAYPKLADVPISGMGGIETWKDAAEFMALGCGNLQITTSVMQYGYRIIDDLMDGMKRYMKQKNYTHIDQLVGQALQTIVSAEELDRSTICYPKIDASKCVGCGRCYLSCYDAGHQALQFGGEHGRPILKATQCVGCQLCAVVCPAGAITPSQPIQKREEKGDDENGDMFKRAYGGED